MEFKPVYADEETLAHHGILGQKLVVRRYQNLDGSLTDEGRRRYGYGSEAGRMMTKNTSERLKQGAKIGSKVGTVAGAIGGVASGAALLALGGPTTPALVAAGYTFTAGTINGLINGTIQGAAIGGIAGAVETHKGRKYIERYDEGLDEFEKLDRSR